MTIQVQDGPAVQGCTSKTLLESLEQQGVEVHYHCREGFCGACRTKLIEGQVEYATDPLAFIDDDEILPCCCKPLSNLLIRLA
ncbi:class I ribonucleotide reductase maintenance protein YfaE [Aliiglaciecola sp. CAU 1673]|uniref:class I ribonucleotide reductase maintenance protein YfaE n=1 Tax=Aliiglaciecola sp. CAU 1673 TaxID=3032595 RepID=UPI0023DC7F9A|nr:class I ribonucleotide reductase maintenance protein YfaE [Aliiglaciecola sp. CAU 1673]MDF2177664.1 class I ribonucleotide reductase maintenance protein YfaE [Aliiglaciecola sp. CAU 1673]